MGRISMKTPPMLTNFLGLDLKLGASIISLFGLLNKVAGVYGMMAVITGGTVAQLTMYIYSLATLFVFIWGFKSIAEENGPRSLMYAHLFALDHLVGTIYTTLFAVVWYVYVPHDGRRVANSDAQKQMMGDIDGTMMGLNDEERAAAAQAVWKSERGFAAAVLLAGWFIKIYFIFVLYSFAMHLRRNTYHALPKTRPRGPSFINSYAYNPPPRLQRYPSRSGEPRYSHLRGTSGNTSIGTDTTLAETLWEGDETSATLATTAVGTAPSVTRVRSNSGAAATAATAASLIADSRASLSTPVGGISSSKSPAPRSPGPGESKPLAKGTGLTRSLSGGVLQRSDSIGAVNAGGVS
ncbi:hypothetical protein OIV83_005453 [Microbotryomycetes sp. JL201]|nr:hypothetical protein OIV83_005453 [Microbotryomycetes sp. JL201]